MKDIKKLIAIIKQNDEISRKFSDIETQILSTLTFSGLFEVLLSEIKNKFQMPYVWISLVDSCEVLELIRSIYNSGMLKHHLRIIDVATFKALVPTGREPLLVNENVDRYSALFLNDQNSLIGSMAIAPITLEGAIIGSLNQADFSKTRFAPGIDTCLLESLARKVSLCLSNVTAHEKLTFLAYHDPLTGLLNRRVMESILKREFIRCKRYSSPLSVVFLDLDNFKGINDLLGHNVGDQMLQHLAKSLTQLVRNSDVVARFAGDEFVVILPQTDPGKTYNMMERIRISFENNPFQIMGHSLPIGISFGVASTEDTCVIDPSSLLSLADKRLYKMKELKKNSIPKSNKAAHNNKAPSE